MNKKTDYEILELIDIVNTNYSKMSKLYDDNVLTNENTGEYYKKLVEKLLMSAYTLATNLNGRRNGKTKDVKAFVSDSDKLKEYVISLELNLLAYKEVCDILKILIMQRINP